MAVATAPSVAFTGSRSLTVNVSFSSSNLSSAIVTSIVPTVVPAVNVSTLSAAAAV